MVNTKYAAKAYSQRANLACIIFSVTKFNHLVGRETIKCFKISLEDDPTTWVVSEDGRIIESDEFFKQFSDSNM